MRIITKITLLVTTLVFIAALFKFLPSFEDGNREVATQLPVGAPNVVHEQGGLVPSTVGYRLEEVQPLETLMGVNPRPVFQQVLDTVYNNVYQVMPCSVNKSTTNVVMFTKTPDQDARIPGTQNADAALAAWEPYVYADIGAFIYPEHAVPPSPPLLKFEYVPTLDAKRATIPTMDNQYIYIGERLNFVFYAADYACLEAGMDLVYDRH